MANFSGPVHSVPLDSTTRETTASIPLGTRVSDGNGNEWCYIKATTAVAAYEAVTFDGSAAGYDDMRPSTDVNEYVFGVASAAFAQDDYGFVQTKGVCVCKVIAATAAKSLLVADATTGTLKLATEAESLAGNRPAVALVTGVAAGSEIYLG